MLDCSYYVKALSKKMYPKPRKAYRNEGLLTVVGGRDYPVVRHFRPPASSSSSTSLEDSSSSVSPVSGKKTTTTSYFNIDDDNKSNPSSLGPSSSPEGLEKLRNICKQLECKQKETLKECRRRRPNIRLDAIDDYAIKDIGNFPCPLDKDIANMTDTFEYKVPSKERASFNDLCRKMKCRNERIKRCRDRYYGGLTSHEYQIYRDSEDAFCNYYPWKRWIMPIALAASFTHLVGGLNRGAEALRMDKVVQEKKRDFIQAFEEEKAQEQRFKAEKAQYHGMFLGSSQKLNDAKEALEKAKMITQEAAKGLDAATKRAQQFYTR